MKEEKVGGKKNPLLYAPFSDTDRDGVPNALDCNPTNPMEQGLWDWTRARLVTPVYQRIYKHAISRVRPAITRFKPTVSYETAARRRAAVIRKPAKIVRKLKKRIPERKELARFAIKRTPLSLVSTQLIKKLPDFKKIKPEARVVTPRIPTIVPGRMGLLAGAEVVTPFLKEKVPSTVRRISTFVGIPAWKQKKVVEKEISDVQKLESEYIKKGWIKPVHPSERRPEDIGMITGIYPEKGFVRPSPQLEMQFVGSPEYQAQVDKIKGIDVSLSPYVKGGVYTSPDITAFEQKWKPYTKGKHFTGSDVQYEQYLREGKMAEGRQDTTLSGYNTAISKLEELGKTRVGRYEALTKEYGEYEEAQKKYERLHGLSIIGKYETKETKLGKRLAPVTSFIGKSIAYAKTPEIKTETKRTYVGYRSLFGLPSKPFKIEEKLIRVESEHKMGIVKGLQKTPLKTVVTTASMFVLPPALKGAGWTLKTAKVGTATAKIPVIGKPLARHAGKLFGIGLGGAYGYSVEERIRAAPAEERMGMLGELTSTEFIPMAVGGWAGAKYGIPAARKGVTKVGEITGLVRAKTYPHKIVPYMSRAEQVEMIFEKPYITGATAAPTGKIPTTPYMTIGRKGLLEPYGKYFTGKREQWVFDTTYKDTIIKGKVPSKLKSIFKEKDISLSVGAKIKKLGLTPGEIKAKQIKAKWLVKNRGRDYYIKEYGEHEIRVELKTEPYDVGRVYIQTGRTVRLPEQLKQKVYESIRTKGEFKDYYPEIKKIALEQSKALGGERIGIPTKKRAFGEPEPESEVLFMTWGKPKITGKKFIGYSSEGIPTYRLQYGTEPKISGFSFLENVGYNIRKQSHYFDAQMKDILRKKSELYGEALTYGQKMPKVFREFEVRKHGRIHAEEVEKGMLELRKTNPKLQRLTEEEIHLIAKYHDIAKIEWFETEPIKHAKVAAMAIRKGRLKDPLLDKLTSKQREEVARAIELHTKIKPGVLTTVMFRPSEAAKTLANIDRMALGRMGIKVKPEFLFKAEPIVPLAKRIPIKGVDIGDARWRGFMIGEHPILGIKGRKFTVGEPLGRVDLGDVRIRTAGDLFEVTVPRRAQEFFGKPVSPTMRLKPIEAKTVESAVQLMRYYAGKKLPMRRTLAEALTRVDIIPKKAIPELVRSAERADATTYGTVSHWMFMKKPKVDPADWDTASLNPGKLRQEFLSIIQKYVGKENAKISRTNIIIKKGGKWHDAIDVHTETQIRAELKSPVFDISLLPFQKISGGKMVTPGQQLIRKGSTWLVWERGGELVPRAPHRIKDIPGFTRLLREYIEVEKASKGMTPEVKEHIRLLEEIKALEEPKYPEFKGMFAGIPTVKRGAPTMKVSEILKFEMFTKGGIKPTYKLSTIKRPKGIPEVPKKPEIRIESKYYKEKKPTKPYYVMGLNGRSVLSYSPLKEYKPVISPIYKPYSYVPSPIKKGYYMPPKKGYVPVLPYSGYVTPLPKGGYVPYTPPEKEYVPYVPPVEEYVPYIPPEYTPPKSPPYRPPPFPPYRFRLPIITVPPKKKKKPEEIKKLRREPWAAIQTTVKNPILSADELIKKLL